MIDLSKNLCLGVALVCICLCVSAPLFAQDDETARLQRAAALIDLGDVDKKPWNLVLDVTVFDDKGEHPSHGTIEMWKSGDNTREVFTFGNQTLTRLQIGKDIYREYTGDGVPYRATEILDQVLHPGPVAEDGLSIKPTVQKHEFGKITLDCLMLAPAIKDVSKVSLGLYPTFCLNPGSDVLRATYNFVSRGVILNNVGNFLDHKVATQVDIVVGRIIVATAKVTTLTTYDPDANQFKPTVEMQHNLANAARVSGGVIAGNIVSKVTPIYPDSARAYHVGGTVVLHALIGRDGHVYSLRPISSPDPSLTLSAIVAVQQWRYKPYLLNGLPTEIDTTIMVNFNIN